jgi:hypothetical protein
VTATNRRQGGAQLAIKLPLALAQDTPHTLTAAMAGD